jgi:hypothetical protein
MNTSRLNSFWLQAVMLLSQVFAVFMQWPRKVRALVLVFLGVGLLLAMLSPIGWLLWLLGHLLIIAGNITLLLSNFWVDIFLFIAVFSVIMYRKPKVWQTIKSAFTEPVTRTVRPAKSQTIMIDTNDYLPSQVNSRVPQAATDYTQKLTEGDICQVCSTPYRPHARVCGNCGTVRIGSATKYAKR